MTKNEKKKLATLIIDMQHASHATYETASCAENLLEAFPCVKEFVWDLEEDTFTSKVCDILRGYLHSKLDPTFLGKGRYAPVRELNAWALGNLFPIVDEYIGQTEDLAEDVFEYLTEHAGNEVISVRIKEILESSMWRDTVFSHTTDPVRRRYLTNELEEYSFIKEMEKNLA